MTKTTSTILISVFSTVLSAAIIGLGGLAITSAIGRFGNDDPLYVDVWPMRFIAPVEGYPQWSTYGARFSADDLVNDWVSSTEVSLTAGEHKSLTAAISDKLKGICDPADNALEAMRWMRGFALVQLANTGNVPLREVRFWADSAKAYMKLPADPSVATSEDMKRLESDDRGTTIAELAPGENMFLGVWTGSAASYENWQWADREFRAFHSAGHATLRIHLPIDPDAPLAAVLEAIARNPGPTNGIIYAIWALIGMALLIGGGWSAGVVYDWHRAKQQAKRTSGDA